MVIQLQMPTVLIFSTLFSHAFQRHNHLKIFLFLYLDCLVPLTTVSRRGIPESCLSNKLNRLTLATFDDEGSNSYCFSSIHYLSKVTFFFSQDTVLVTWAPGHSQVELYPILLMFP